jgi:hypothetical protein
MAHPLYRDYTVSGFWFGIFVVTLSSELFGILGKLRQHNHG